MKSFRDFLEESIRKYRYRVKLAVVDVTESRLDLVEKIFSKYEIYEMTRPKKTIIQEHPLDFYDVQNADITIIDVITRVPLSPYNVQQELKVALNIPEKYVVVRNWDEPREKETQQIQQMKELEAEAAKKGMTAAPHLSTESQTVESSGSIEGKKFFGNEYNLNLLKYLSATSSTRTVKGATPESSLSQPEEMKMEKQADFNEGIADAPRPVPRWERTDLDKDMDISSVQGKYDNITDEVNTVGKIYRDKKGERIFFKGNK